MSVLLEKLLRIAEVEAATGLNRSTLYRLIQQSAFPQPIQLSPAGRSVAWKASEVSAWIEERADKGRAEWQANRPKAQALAKKRRASKPAGAQP